MPEPEEEGFSVVDKRGVSSTKDEPAEAEPEPQPVAEPDMDPAEEPAIDEVDASDEHRHPALTTQDRMLMCIDILHAGAWISMGLVQDPVKGTIERNMDDARALIDCVSLLADKASPRVDDRGKKDLQNLVSTLRMNFVNQMSKKD